MGCKECGTMPKMMPQGSGRSTSKRGSITSEGTGGSASASVLTFELCDEETFTSPGATSYLARPVGPVLDGLGPHIQDIVVHVLGRVFSSNFKYKVIAERSYDGEAWTVFSADVLSEQTTTGYKISSAYSTRSDLNVMIRFLIAVSDTGSKEIGTLSASVAIRLWQ